MLEFYTRPAMLDDFDTVLPLVQAHLAADYQGENSLSAEDLQQIWEAFNLETDTSVVTDSSGRILGHGWFPSRERDNMTILDPQFYVLPDLRGQGIEVLLLDAAEKRAMTNSGGMVVIQPMVTNVTACQALEQAGYKFELAFQKMVVEFDQPPSSGEFPAGLDIRTFVPGKDEQAAYQADEEASLDKDYSHPVPFERWAARMLNNPELCFLAWDGEEVAGGVFTQNYEGQGLVHHIGVRRPWRKRGLGAALMQRTFFACYVAGLGKIWLEVDTTSPTGATRLYERIGMRVVGVRSYFSKEITGS